MNLCFSSIATNVGEDQRRTKLPDYLNSAFFLLCNREEQNPPAADESKGVRNKEIETLDVSMAKQTRKRKTLALSTIVKLSSTKLNAQLRPISRLPRVRRKSHHRPARRCCVTQSEEQVSKYSILDTGLPLEKVCGTRYSLVACHFISVFASSKPWSSHGI